MFNERLKKRVKFLEELTEVRGRRIDALQERQKELTKSLELLVENTSKCYHSDHKWKSDGDGGLLKYCNDCKCYV